MMNDSMTLTPLGHAALDFAMAMSRYNRAMLAVTKARTALENAADALQTNARVEFQSRVKIATERQ